MGKNYGKKIASRRGTAAVVPTETIPSIPATAPVTPLATLPGLEALQAKFRPLAVKGEVVTELKAQAHQLAAQTEKLDAIYHDLKQQFENADVELQALTKEVSTFRHNLLSSYYNDPELQAAMKADPDGVVEREMLKMANEITAREKAKQVARMAELGPEVELLRKETAKAKYEANKAGNAHRAKFAEAEAEEEKEVVLAAA